MQQSLVGVIANSVAALLALAFAGCASAQNAAILSTGQVLYLLIFSHIWKHCTPMFSRHAR